MARLRVGTGLAAFLFILSLVVQATPAEADCTGGRMSCRPPNYPALQTARSEYGHIYGALAYSPRNGSYGWSTGYDDSESANAAAMETCSAHGPGCYVVISFSNLCASVSVDDEGAVSWGTGGTRTEAQYQSQNYCRKQGGRNCEIKVWACSIP